MKIKKEKLIIHGDSRGSLVALNGGIDIPFKIRRVYYMYDTKFNVRRGGHAHKDLEQILIAVHGQCKIHLDDGVETTEMVLNSPDEGLYINSNVWREMYDFSNDCVLMVLASKIYDENDYIRNYDDFIKYVNK